MTYAIAKATKTALEANHNAAVAYLKEVSGTERGPMGLTPDHIKQSAEWKVAFNAERAAFKTLREFNRWMTKNFKKEIRNDRLAGG